MSNAMAIDVKITGDAAWMKKLEALGKEALDFKEGLDKAGDELVAYYGGQVFESQGGVFGTPWQSLSARTQAFKIKHFSQYAAVPLMATGTMRDSFEKAEVSMKHMEVINTAPYFKYHQSTLPRSKIPRRPMIAINKDVKDIVRDAIKLVLVEQLRKI